jgi:hypothetical protein
MGHTYTRTRALFLAGESAPAPEAAAQGATIVNHYGNVALFGLREDGHTVTLNTDVQPPVLELRHAVVQMVMGYLEEGGTFNSDGFHASPVEVNGDYYGPDSKLEVS